MIVDINGVLYPIGCHLPRYPLGCLMRWATRGGMITLSDSTGHLIAGGGVVKQVTLSFRP